MKTLKIALASALIVLSLNSFAETCNPCTLTGNLREDSINFSTEETPRDVKVTEMIQKMTVTVREQMTNSNAATTKHQKHNKKKAHA